MKALIFAAGLGTRLGSITSTCPKALVEVGGEPMLKRVILKLKAAGINDFVVNVHHHAQMIVDYLKANDYFGANISISDESQHLLDTGGGLLKARNLLDGNEPVIIHNADILTDFDLCPMIKQHLSSKADATLLVAKRETSRYLLFDNDMRMRGWTDVRTNEIRTPWDSDTVEQCTRYAFGGIHIVSPTIFPELEKFGTEPKFSITPFYISACKNLNIMGFMPEESYHWCDIGKPQSLIDAQNIVSKLRPTVQGEC